MIYKCTSCQHETPQGLPPKPAKPDACERCGGVVTGVHDTLPPPAVDALPDDEEPIMNGTRPKLLISTALYALSRELGAAEAEAELRRQVDELSGPFAGQHAADEFIPVAYLIARARRLFDVGLYIDAGATQIGKSRCRAMAFAMQHSEFEVWIAADDDVECTVATLVGLYDAVIGQTAIAIGPCFLRGKPLVNVAFPQVVVDRTLPGNGAKLRTALYGGFGLVAMSQSALTRVAAASPWFKDDDGKEKPGAFIDVVHPAQTEGTTQPAVWFGEDLSFFLRAPKSVRIEALLTGHTRHAGETLNLARLDEYESFTPTEAWRAARDAIHPPEVTDRKVLAAEPKPKAEKTVVD